MTRDEAKARINYTGNYSKENVYELIDWIYDDFENRICKNCKHDNCGCSIQDTIWFYECKHNKSQTNLDSFGCNKFKRRSE